jgi:hypothetical protein
MNNTMSTERPNWRTDGLINVTDIALRSGKPSMRYVSSRSQGAPLDIHHHGAHMRSPLAELEITGVPIVLTFLA